MRIKFRGLTYFAVLVLTLLILYFGLRGTNSSISNVKQPTKNRNIFNYARTHILHTITKYKNLLSSESLSYLACHI